MIDNIEKIENLLKLGKFEVMYRVEFNGLRMYIKKEPFKYYSGLTGALNAATFSGDPEKRRLKKWREGFIDSLGQKAANDYLDMTADFGTLLHTALVTIKTDGCINWAYEKDHAMEYFIGCYKKKLLEPDYRVIKSQVYEYQKHVASLLQFVYEMVQEIYAIETPARWEHLQIATPIDLFCKCKQTPKGKFKNTTINLKTSSGISKGHLEQVACEMIMWNETYSKGDPNGKLRAEYTAILRTKDWTEGKTPSYEYKYLTTDAAIELTYETMGRLQICLNSDASYLHEPTSKVFEGVTKIGECPQITIKTLEQVWMEAQEQLNEIAG